MADSLQANLDRAAGYLKRFQSRRCPAFHRRRAGPIGFRRDVRDARSRDQPEAGDVASGDAEDIDRAAAAAAARFPRLARYLRRQAARRSCTPSPTRSRRAPTRSRSSNPPTPASRSATWRRRRCAAPRISASTPTARPAPATAARCRTPITSTIRCASRSAPSASSRRGTRRSCCRRGRSRPRSPRAARSSTSPPNGARSPP